MDTSALNRNSHIFFLAKSKTKEKKLNMGNLLHMLLLTGNIDATENSTSISICTALNAFST